MRSIDNEDSQGTLASTPGGGAESTAESRPDTVDDRPATESMRSFKILVLSYLVIGSISVVLFVVAAAFQGSLYIDATVLFLAVGVGLLLRKPSWRVLGRAISVLVVLKLGALCVVVLGSWGLYERILLKRFDILVGNQWSHSLLYIAIGLFFAFIAFCIWSFFLLGRPHVKALFQKSRSSVSSYLSALIILLLLVTAARETGGLDLNLSIHRCSTFSGSSEYKPSLAKLETKTPLLIEFHGIDPEMIIIVTKLEVRRVETPSGRGTSRSWQTQWESFTGIFARKARDEFKSRSQVVRVDVKRIKFKGAYWFPLYKVGTTTFEATMHGEGNLEKYKGSLYGNLQFSNTGICSVRNLRDKMQGQITQMVLNKIIKSAID